MNKTKRHMNIFEYTIKEKIANGFDNLDSPQIKLFFFKKKKFQQFIISQLHGN